MLQTTTDDDDSRQTASLVWPPTLCVFMCRWASNNELYDTQLQSRVH